MTTTEIRIPKMPDNYVPQLSGTAESLFGAFTAVDSRLFWFRRHGYRGGVDRYGHPTELDECDACGDWVDGTLSAACALADYCPTCMADHEVECRRCADPGE